jgi:very-short-patch-repair endonuclease
VYAARRLRAELSLPEVLLWKALKAAPDGPKFRRQHPIGPYIAHFYCAAARLVVEIEGIAHDMGDRSQRDAARTAFLEAQGYIVLRIPASEVLRDASGIAASVAAAASPLRQSLRACHLPTSGEDL